METDLDLEREEDSDTEYAGTPRKRRKTRRPPRTTAVCKPPSSAERGSPKRVEQKRASRRIDTQFQTDESRCIICQQEKRDKGKNRRLFEKLTTCTSLRGTLRNAATLRANQRVLLNLVGGDDVAAEVKYHRSCYQRYTNSKDLQRLVGAEETKTDPYDIAFAKLLQEIEGPIHRGDRLFTVPILCNRFNESVIEQGLSNPHYRSEKLKCRLRKHFGDDVVFYQTVDLGKPCVLYSAQLSLIRVAELLQEPLDDSEDCDWHDDSECTVAQVDSLEDGLAAPSVKNTADTDIVDLFHIATMIRTDLYAIKDYMPWPPAPADLCVDNVVVPTSLYNLLSWIIVGDDDIPTNGEKVPVKSADDQRRILSIAQDILFCTRRGRVKPPKHVALPMAVYHLTRSTQLVSLLNGFGHGISASQLLEIDTALAQQELDRSGDVVLPANIVKTASAVFCFDNFDLCEETRTGANTTHCTNGIVVQRLPAARLQPTLQDVYHPKQSHWHKRSVVAPVTSEPQPYFTTSRVGPPRLPFDFCLVQSIVFPKCVQKALAIDFLWLSSRLPFTISPLFGKVGCQVVPSWTPFNSIFHQERIPRQSVIGYCQVIDAPPTDLTAVHDVLQRAAAMARELPQQDVVVVFDQAVYSKAQEILWKGIPALSHIVCRMGGFHTSMMLLAIIGKRYGDAGLRDIFVETEIVSAGSVDGVLSGKHYNRAIRAHKTVAEALFRVHWSQFEQYLDKADSRMQIDVTAFRDLLCNLRTNMSPASIASTLDNSEFQAMESCYRQFCSTNLSPSASLWKSYIDMVLLLLRFTRATREAQWNLHLQCVRDMLPWAFAYDRVNYARYLSAYFYEMSCLPVTRITR